MNTKKKLPRADVMQLVVLGKCKDAIVELLARVCNFLPEIALAAGQKSDKWGVSF